MTEENTNLLFRLKRGDWCPASGTCGQGDAIERDEFVVRIAELEGALHSAANQIEYHGVQDEADALRAIADAGRPKYRDWQEREPERKFAEDYEPQRVIDARRKKL
jgi:hypothetical protein